MGASSSTDCHSERRVPGNSGSAAKKAIRRPDFTPATIHPARRRASPGGRWLASDGFDPSRSPFSALDQAWLDSKKRVLRHHCPTQCPHARAQRLGRISRACSLVAAGIDHRSIRGASGRSWLDTVLDLIAGAGTDGDEAAWSHAENRRDVHNRSHPRCESSRDEGLRRGDATGLASLFPPSALDRRRLLGERRVERRQSPVCGTA